MKAVSGSLELTRGTLAVGKAYCSTANLGAGFDVFGLALDHYFDLVRVRLTSEKRIRIVVKGLYGKGLPTAVEGNSAGPPALEMLRRADAQKGLEIIIEKNVPIGLGLGSSGATAAACVKALDSILELNLSDEALVQIASLGEAAVAGTPHVDNVAASLLGGFVIVYGRDPVQVISMQPPSSLAMAVVTPEIQLPSNKTRLARTLLPKTVKVESAVLNVGRASAIAAGFARGDIDVIGRGMEDEIAEPYREKLIPGYRAVKKVALASQASGVAISGAGPSVVALVNRTRSSPKQVARAMVREFSRNKVKSTFFIANPATGARIVRRG